MATLGKAMFTSEKETWATPDALFDALAEEFVFVFDLAADETNHRCPNYYAKADNALEQDWSAIKGPCWLNPPYGRQVGLWVKKAAERGGVVMLLPARTDVRWWHDYVWDANLHQPRPGVEVRFVKGRLKFKGAKAAAPFPSVVVVFR